MRDLLLIKAVFLVAAAVTASSARGQEPGSIEWFKQQWKLAQAARIPDGFFLSYAEESGFWATPQRLVELEQAVEGKPDHPDRHRLVIARRVVERGPDRTEYRLWHLAPDRWRISTDMNTEDLPYWDRVSTPKVVWSLSPGQLAVVDPHHDAPYGRNYSQAAREFTDHFRLIRYSGMAEGACAGLEPTSAKWEGTVWTGIAESGDGGSAAEWRGRLHDNGMMVIIESRTIIRSEKYPRSVGLRLEFANWAIAPAADGLLAGEVCEQSPADEVLRRFVLLSVGEVRADEFAVIARVPTVEDDDSIRGGVRPMSIIDYRPGRDRLLLAGTDGMYTEEALPTEWRVTRASWKTYAGWGVASALISIGVLAWWARRGGLMR
mgnify:CR=1 FL=1